MSSTPSSQGLSTSRHSVSWPRKSLGGQVGDATVTMPGMMLMSASNFSVDASASQGGAGDLGLPQKSIPPPPGIAGIGVSFFGFSATIASVVTSRPATEAASWSAVRTTLAGSMTPWL